MNSCSSCSADIQQSLSRSSTWSARAQFLVFQSSGCVVDIRMHLFSTSTSADVGSAIDLANSLLANCNSIRSVNKYASRMTLERYDVESCGESLIVRELSLVSSPGVFTPFLFVCKPEFLINSSECLGSASISIRSGAFPNGGTTIVSHDSEIVPHTRQGAVVADPMLQFVSRVNVCSSLP